MPIRIHLLRGGSGRGPSGSPDGRRPEAALRAVPGGVLGRVLAVFVGGVILIAGLFVSAVVFSMLLVAGVFAGGWFWWKTRGLRRQLADRMTQMRQMQAAQRSDSPGAGRPGSFGDVIDGDFIRESGANVDDAAPPASGARRNDGFR